MTPSSTQALSALSSTGLQLNVGPFLVRVRSDLPGVARHLEQFYSHFPRRVAAEGHFDIAIVGSGGVRRWLRPQATLVANGRAPFLPLPANLAGPLLEWAMNWCIAANAHRWLLLHSAVVERGGRALVMPAASGSGKSTLCAALTYSGWRLLSDEFAIIDPVNRQLAPAPRPISLKEGSIAIIKNRHPDTVFSEGGIDVEGARFVHALPPLDSVERVQQTASIGWIVFPRYVQGSRTTIEPLAKAQALVEMVKQTFNYGPLGLAGFSCLAKVVEETDCYRLEYSDLDDLLPRLVDIAAR